MWSKPDNSRRGLDTISVPSRGEGRRARRSRARRTVAGAAYAYALTVFTVWSSLEPVWPAEMAAAGSMPTDSACAQSAAATSSNTCAVASRVAQRLAHPGLSADPQRFGGRQPGAAGGNGVRQARRPASGYSRQISVSGPPGHLRHGQVLLRRAPRTALTAAFSTAATSREWRCVTRRAGPGGGHHRLDLVLAARTRCYHA